MIISGNIKVVMAMLLMAVGVVACGSDENKEEEKPDVATVVIDKAKVEIAKGASVRLTAKMSDGKSSTFVWETEDEHVATVAGGLVTGISAGETVVKATAEDGVRFATCQVVVTDDTKQEEEQTDYEGRRLGGDISMFSAYHDLNTIYKDIDGKTVDLLPFFKQQGMDAMRVRLFVDPYNEATHEKAVIQDLKYVKRLAKTIKDSGFEFMLDFHYSDYWADPVKQTVPASWSGLDAQGLTDKLYAYTKEVLADLAGEGLAPHYVQIGNEVSYGMLWPAGRVAYNSDDNWDVFAAMLKSAGKACREVLPDTKVIVHIERSENAGNCVKFIEQMDKYGVDYDILGLSYYPFWHGRVSAFDGTLNKIEEATDKDIMIVEFAYYYNWYPTDAKYSAADIGYEGTAEGQQAVTKALIEMLDAHQQVKGLFWWFPEENECPYTALLDAWVNRGLFDNSTGKALPALYELKAFKNK